MPEGTMHTVPYVPSLEPECAREGGGVTLHPHPPPKSSALAPCCCFLAFRRVDVCGAPQPPSSEALGVVLHVEYIYFYGLAFSRLDMPVAVWWQCAYCTCAGVRSDILIACFRVQRFNRCLQPNPQSHERSRNRVARGLHTDGASGEREECPVWVRHGCGARGGLARHPGDVRWIYRTNSYSVYTARYPPLN